MFYPFRIKWSFHFNILKNIGFVVFKVLFIRLLCERFKINNKCEFEYEKEKKKSKKNQEFFHEYIMALAKRVDVKRIDFFSEIGLVDDAYFLSMFDGFVSVGLYNLIGLFLNKYKDIKIFYDNTVVYEGEKLEFTGKIIVTFSLVSVIISVISALKILIKKRKVNNYGR